MTMRVAIYDVDPPATKVFRCEATLAECFPDDPDVARETEAEIRRCGQSWHGGGAAPLTILEEVKP